MERALAACSIECPDQYPDVLGALYHAFWIEKKRVQLPDVYEPIIADALGKDLAARVIEKVGHQNAVTPAIAAKRPCCRD